MVEISITIRLARTRTQRPARRSTSTAICAVCGRPGTARGWAGHMAARRHGAWVPVEHEHDDEEIRRALGRE